jgi:hypothetical protein
LLAGGAQELGAGPPGLGQDHLDVRPGDLQRDARQAGPGAHVDQGRGELDELQDQQAIDIVLQHHVLEIVDARQVQLGVGPAEQPMIGPELVELRVRQRHPATLHDGPQRSPTRNVHESKHPRDLAMINCSRCDRTAGRAGRTAGWPT